MLLRSFTLATNLPRSMKPLTVWRRYIHAGQSTFEATVEQVHPVPAAFGDIPLHQVSAGGVGWQFCEIGFDLGDLGSQGGQQIANLPLGLAARKVQACPKTSTVDRHQ